MNNNADRNADAPKANGERQRLDVAMVARGLTATRARARDLVLRGEVTVGGRTATRPATTVAAADRIEVRAGVVDWVSRGALKLVAGLDAFGIEPANLIGLDVGASTGGFTQALLSRGAAKVYAVENGRDQLAAVLRNDPRVISLERTDARTLTASAIPEKAGIVVCDLSFVSLRKVLPDVLPFAAAGAWLVALVKPQFELEPSAIGKDGVVKSDADRSRAVEDVRAWMSQQRGWRVLGLVPSPITGGSGNVEFLIGARRDG